MASNSIGYAGNWRRLHPKALLSAVAALAIAGAVIAGATALDRQQAPSLADSTKVVRVAPAGGTEQTLTLYMVASERQRLRVVSAEDDAAAVAINEHEQPAPYMVVVASDEASLLDFLDTMSIREQSGLPSRIVDLR